MEIYRTSLGAARGLVAVEGDEVVSITARHKFIGMDRPIWRETQLRLNEGVDPGAQGDLIRAAQHLMMGPRGVSHGVPIAEFSPPFSAEV